MSELIQHDLHVWARKIPAKWKTKTRRASLQRNHYTDRIEQQRPHTTGALLGQIIIQELLTTFLRKQKIKLAVPWFLPEKIKMSLKKKPIFYS